MAEAITGGCQCGAVRFSAERLGGAAICHCRMCQKAFGGFFGPFVSGYGVAWTRGAPSYFESSNLYRRGFCAACGTPLTYERVGRREDDAVELAIGALDDPTLAAPTQQVNPADKLPFFDGLAALPMRAQPPSDKQDLRAALVSYKHPDFETAEWPPTGHYEDSHA